MTLKNKLRPGGTSGTTGASPGGFKASVSFTSFKGKKNFEIGQYLTELELNIESCI